MTQSDPHKVWENVRPGLARIRVPGGWIYHVSNTSNPSVTASPVFVPDPENKLLAVVKAVLPLVRPRPVSSSVQGTDVWAKVDDFEKARIVDEILRVLG